MDNCSIQGCPNPVDCRDWCKMHVTRFYRNGDPLAVKSRMPRPPASIAQIRERFLSKIEKCGDCWIWMPGKNRYGTFHLGKAFGGHRLKPAHQASYLLHKGPIRGLHVLHQCDNDRCVNPSHLYLGTHQDNMRDRKLRQRTYRAAGELNASAKLTAAQVTEMRALRGFHILKLDASSAFRNPPLAATAMAKAGRI